METEELTTYLRSSCKKENLSKRFQDTDENYGKQYSSIYFVRSQLMKERIIEAAKLKWGQSVNMKQLSDVVLGEKCCIIGTLFKVMELQPSILKEISDELNIPVHPGRNKFTSETDKLVLEDAMQRISLTGNINPNMCFTGTVVALLGKESISGQFHVEDMTYPGIPVQSPYPDICEESQYVLFLSGLGIGSKQEKTFQIQLLIDYIIGMLGDNEDHALCSQIVHVIIAGNSLSGDTQDKVSQKKAKYLTYKTEASTVTAVKDLDFFLSQLVPYVSVDVMSGEYDPSNHVLPQRPMHACLFPLAQKYHGSSFSTVPNPYECKINGVHMLGTSGQNINNLKMFSGVDDSITLMLETLRFQHLAPTAPDTLGCFPYYKSDPFIIDHCPHIYFCGNQDKFAFSIEEGSSGQKILLLSIPEFVKTSSVVIVNLKTYHVQEIFVDVNWHDGSSTEDPDN